MFIPDTIRHEVADFNQSIYEEDLSLMDLATKAKNYAQSVSIFSEDMKKTLQQNSVKFLRADVVPYETHGVWQIKPSDSSSPTQRAAAHSPAESQAPRRALG